MTRWRRDALFASIEASNRAALVRASVTKLGKGLGTRKRARAVVKTLGSGTKLRKQMTAARCEVAVHLASRIGLGDGVGQALAQMYERWDGKGMTAACQAKRFALPRGSATSRPKRSCTAASTARTAPSRWFVSATAVTSNRNNPSASPKTMLVGHGARRRADTAQPGSDRTRRHHSGVCRLRRSQVGVHARPLVGRRRARGSRRQAERPRREGVHGVAPCARCSTISAEPACRTSIWERKGKLTIAEWEQIRLHAYFTDRILRRSPLLSELAPIAAANHERVDGSGLSTQRAGVDDREVGPTTRRGRRLPRAE